jgi:hypothetical protein
MTAVHLMKVHILISSLFEDESIKSERTERENEASQVRIPPKR